MNTDRFWFLVIVLLSLIVIGNLLPAQEININNDVWSITYWQKLAEQGLVEVTPADATNRQLPLKYDSRIYANKVLTDDSPDVPVTTQTDVTQSETSIFINPNNDQKVLNSNNSSDLPVTTIYGASYWVSDDAGLTWVGSEQGAGGSQRGDPACAIDLSGRYYIGYIAANSGNGCAYSNDEGQTWTHVQVAPNPGSLADKNHLWVDNSPTSPYQGNLYAAWTDFGGANDHDVVISRSTDGGLTWSTLMNISNGLALYLNQGVNVQTGPNGEVYVVWVIYDTSTPLNDTGIGFTKSLDGGVTWSTPVRIIDNILGIRSFGLGGGKTMRTSSFPSMTVNQNDGSLYVVWPNVGVPSVNTGDPDIYMIKSSDGGSNWSTPSRVNQDPIGNGKDQWYPWIACDPSTGFLVCIFYDSRNFPANDQAETFVAASTDGGNSWEDFKVSDVSWSGDGFSGFASNYAGDYIGIDILNGKVYPVWADVRGGQLMAWVSPFLLADPMDPNPPSEFEAYSNYSTPTSMDLTWSDPTNLANGDTLLSTDFQIHILRDDLSIDSVAGGTEQYTDTGLMDGTTYTYTLFTKMLTNDSTSLGVNASWIAGGSPVPNPPVALSITNQSGGQLMAHWINPSTNIDKTPMDDFGAINLYENNVLLTTFSRSPGDTSANDSALFTPGGPNLPYYLTAVDNEIPPNESSTSNTSYPPFVAPYTQDFESGTPGTPGVLPIQWTNESDDNWDWYVDEGGTPSSSTGPEVDHTTGTSTGNYMFIESSSPHFNETAHLTSPFIELSTVANPGMAFWYHMYGQSMGELHVDVYANGMWNLDIMPPLIGQQQQNQTDPWLQAVIDLSAFSGGPIQVRFRGITGGNFYSDMAIDDVFFGSLSANPQMAVLPSIISDTLLVGGSSMHTATVLNLAILPTSLNYTVSENPPENWLVVTPTSGVVTSGQSDNLDVTFDASGLTAGNYDTEIIISGNDTTNFEDTISVALVVNDAPVISVIPDTFDVMVASGNTLDTTFTIHNTGLGPLNFEASVGGALPEIIYYKFDEAGANQTQNFAAPGSPAPGTANLLGGLTMGGSGYDGAALIGSGGSSSTDYVDTGWITDLGTGSWTISLWMNNVDNSTTLHYTFGDNTATSFRAFTGGVAGAGNLILRGPISDVTVTGVAPGPSIVDFVYDATAGEVRAYLNGVLNNTVPQTGVNIVGTAPFKVGGYSTSAGINAGMLLDEFKIFNRAIDLETTQSPEANFWLSIDTTSGIIAPGDSLQLTLSFDPTGLLGGDYETEVVITSNDPINPEINVGVHMFVDAAAVIGFNPEPIEFDTTFVNTTTTLSGYVLNPGAGVLNVTDITSTNSVFGVDTTSFEVPPLDSFEVNISFTPTAPGTETGWLVIASSDPNSPLDSVMVQGPAVFPPQIAVTPSVIQDSITVNDSMDVVLQIMNNAVSGAASLDWTALLQTTAKSSYNVITPGSVRNVSTFSASDAPEQIESSIKRLPQTVQIDNQIDITTSEQNDVINTAEFEDGKLSFSGGNDPEPMHVENVLGEEIFGSTANNFSGPDRDRGNIFSVSTPTTLVESRFYLNISVATELTLFVYQGTAATGTYNKINEVYYSNSGTGQGFYSSGPIDIPLEAGFYYYIGAAWLGDATYYRGSTSTPIASSFGMLETGVPGNIANGFPPAATANNTYNPGGFSPYYCAIVTQERPPFIKLLEPTSGSIEPGDTENLNVRIFGLDIPDTTYTANIEITSNDPGSMLVTIPVQIDVKDSVTSITLIDPIPTTFAISQNYPNPFNPTTTIKYQLPQQSDVKLYIYNVLGQKIRTLLNNSVEAGYHSVEWDGRNDTGVQVASGIYIYRFQAGDYMKVQKMMLMK